MATTTEKLYFAIASTTGQYATDLIPALLWLLGFLIALSAIMLFAGGLKTGVRHITKGR